MTLDIKLLLPLLNLDRSDITPEAGFVDLYTKDVNAVHLDNHIFLLYDLEVKTKEAAMREYRMRFYKNISGKQFRTINNHRYLMYIFPIMNAEVRELIYEHKLTKSVDTSLKILKFWKYSDDDVNKFILTSKYTGEKTQWKAIPKDDNPIYLRFGLGCGKS